jgi:rhamnose utilization protein RhaD (predicted bifunctional aldolase and dehydrogenase)
VERELLDTIVALSRRYGRDPHWVIRGGGNTSIKHGREMWVKGSGTALATIEPEQFVRMNLDRLDAIWSADYPAEVEAREDAAKRDLLAARASGEENKRPSVETLMHALFPSRIVYHTHSTLVNAIGCSVDGEDAARRLFGDDLLWIPTVNPGYVLARRIADGVEAYRESRAGAYPPILVLQNHGLVVWGETDEDIDRIHAEIVDRIVVALSDDNRADFAEWQRSIDAAISSDRALECARSVYVDTSGTGSDREIAKVCDRIARIDTDLGASRIVLPLRTGPIDRFLGDHSAFSPLEGALTPDHIVYSGEMPLWVDSIEEIEGAIPAYRAEHALDPHIVAVRGLAAFAIARTQSAAESAALLFCDAAKIATLSTDFGGIRYMPEDQVAFIRSWEVEQFRRSVGEG